MFYKINFLKLFRINNFIFYVVFFISACALKNNVPVVDGGNVYSITASASVQESNLERCEGNYSSLWSDCFGEYIFPSGRKYIGEW